MEIDRIQRIKQLKVERTGSEQERRRKRGESDFSEMLEETLDKEKQDKQEEESSELSSTPPATVSLARDEQSLPLVTDVVSISSSAQVGSAMKEATRKQQQESQRLRELAKANKDAATQPDDDAEEEATEEQSADEADKSADNNASDEETKIDKPKFDTIA
jgi:hypothetical protein